MRGVRGVEVEVYDRVGIVGVMGLGADPQMSW